MNINKRKCRKYAEPGLKMNLRSGLLHAGQIRYIVRTAIKNIAGQRVLVLYIYSRERLAAGNIQPLRTMFQSKEDYITYVQRENGSDAWHTSMFENLEREYGFESKCAFYSPADEQRVLRFCDPAAPSGFKALSHLQNRIKAKKELDRRHVRQRKIKERMTVLGPLPRDLRGWIHREVLPVYLFYDYHKGKVPMKGYCTHCKHEVEINGAKHNQMGICPRCKREALLKSRGRRGYISDRATVQVLQRIGSDRLVIRILKVYCSYRKKETPDINIYENIRIFVHQNEEGKFVESPYHSSYSAGDLTPWKEGYVPVMYQYQENFSAQTCGYLYHRNLVCELAGTPWQYCQLKEFYLSDRSQLVTVPYLRIYLEAPMLEYLVKLRLFWLAAHAVYGSRGYYGHNNVLNMNGSTLKEVLGVEKSDIPFHSRSMLE